MNNILHLDFDNTLACSLYADDEKHADDLLEIYNQYWHGVKFQLPNDGRYVSFIRSWTKELIQYFQLTLGINNVCILSWGSNDYVLMAVEELGINIPPANIFTREDIPSNVPRFKNKNNVLVDNEYYSFHQGRGDNKVNFLYGLDREKFVKVPDFDVRYFRDETDIRIEDLIEHIEKAFEYEET